MGGAFVAVADDATAVYWNPAGLALGGAFFSLVLDARSARSRSRRRAGRPSEAVGERSSRWPRRRSALSYYRLEPDARLAPAARCRSPPMPRRAPRRPTTPASPRPVHDAAFAVGDDAEAVRGDRRVGVVLDGESRWTICSIKRALPSRARPVRRRCRRHGEARRVRLGLTVRNITSRTSTRRGASTIELKRQSRAGVAYLGVPGLIVAADVDLERRRAARSARCGTSPAAPERGSLRAPSPAAASASTRSPISPAVTRRSRSAAPSPPSDRSRRRPGHVGSAAGDRGWGIAARIVY